MLLELQLTGTSYVWHKSTVCAIPRLLQSDIVLDPPLIMMLLADYKLAALRDALYRGGIASDTIEVDLKGADFLDIRTETTS